MRRLIYFLNEKRNNPFSKIVTKFCISSFYYFYVGIQN